MPPIKDPDFIIADLFCGAGGCSWGYYLAFIKTFPKLLIIGIDNKHQHRYPAFHSKEYSKHFQFIQTDALEYIAINGHRVNMIHASPPCQEYAKTNRLWEDKQYPDMIDITRKALITTGKPYIIENVVGSPLRNPAVLDGALFGLLVARKRLFETSFPLSFILSPQNQKPVKMGRPVKDGDVILPVGHFSGVEYARRQMGIDWMTAKELSQAIPPAYTKWIGQQLLTTILTQT